MNQKNVIRIKEISLMDISKDDKGYFFKEVSEMLDNSIEILSKADEKYFRSNKFDDLLAENHRYYEKIVGDNYKTCFGNPEYAVNTLGETVGHVAAYLFAKAQRCIMEAFRHNEEYIGYVIDLFNTLYDFMNSKEYDENKLISVVKDFELDHVELQYEQRVKEIFVYKENDYKTIVNSANDDLNYLFRYGKYITDNEVKMAKFLSGYEGVKKIADTMIKGYMDSFERENKDYKKKDTIFVDYNIGQELIVKELEKGFLKYGIKLTLSQVDTTSPNKQYAYDHKFDQALYFDQDIADKKVEAAEKILERYKTDCSKYSGVALFDKFGEDPFTPASKKENLRFSAEQSAIFQKSSLATRNLQDKYAPNTETTFTIIAFPTPEIGDKFEEIFEETMKINTLDSDRWERIQNEIIKALDQGDYVHVKGKGTNKTDIMVKMHELNDPEKETNFENCIATVNIPVGEVFTSPTLKGTNGLLHVEEVFLGSFKYIDLKLQFEDGYIKEYSCKNFDNEEDNKKYIEENLLFPNKTLPIGEFAIGTNTYAYVVAQKYNIGSILPILIAEKMGPHFAIGDTCYSYSEDNRVYNQYDGKEIVAKDNEKSILRKTDIANAYTQCHTDITIPYEGLESINAVTKDGREIEIIKDGRFVLKGTEELNEPFNTEV